MRLACRFNQLKYILMALPGSHCQAGTAFRLCINDRGKLRAGTRPGVAKHQLVRCCATGMSYGSSPCRFISHNYHVYDWVGSTTTRCEPAVPTATTAPILPAPVVGSYLACHGIKSETMYRQSITLQVLSKSREPMDSSSA